MQQEVQDYSHSVSAGRLNETINSAQFLKHTIHSQGTLTINLRSRYCQEQEPNWKSSQIWQCSVRSIMGEVCACDSCTTKMIPTLTSSLAGYWKWTPSNWISPLSSGSFFPVLLRLSISGTRSRTEKMAAAEPLATANASRCGVVSPMFIAPDSTPNKTYVHDNI